MSDGIDDPSNDKDKTPEPNIVSKYLSYIFPPVVGTTLLDWLTRLYGVAIDGAPGQSRLEDSVNVQSSGRSIEDEISNLIKWSVTEAAGVGFVTNIGGLMTLPVSLPVNIAGVLAIQMRMVAGIAHLRGYDIRDPAMRTTILLCLLGAGATQALADAGVVIAGKLAANAISNIPGKMLIEINKAIGFRLLTKAGTTGVINISRYIPLVGGVFVGTFDAFATQSIASAARSLLQVNSQPRTSEKAPG